MLLGSMTTNLVKRVKRTGGRPNSVVTYLEAPNRPWRDFRKFNYMLAKRLKIRYVDVREIVDTTIDVLADHVARGHRVVIRGFGRFEAPRRPPKLVNDCWRGIQYVWPGGNRAKFRPSDDWVARCNGLPTQNDRLLKKKHDNGL